MTTPAVYQALESPGRLSFGGTSYTSAYPHGGTGLGLFTNVSVRYDPIYVDVFGEERGQVVNRYFCGVNRFELMGDLTSYDPDAVQKVFTNTSAASGTTSGFTGIEIGPDGDAGVNMGTSTFHLVFTPDDTAKGKMIVLYGAIARPRPGLDVQMRLRRLMAIPVEFLGLYDATAGKVADWKKAEDIS